MATKTTTSTSPEMSFLLSWMKRNPTKAYGDAKAAAEKAGHQIYPIMWGRAQVMLGIVKAKPRGTGKAATRKARAAARAAAPTNDRVAAPARRSAANADGVALTIGDSDREAALKLVAAVAGGARLRLGFDGDQWSLTSA